MHARIPARDLDEVLAHTESVWRALDGATLLLTGATGFVGAWLLESIAHARMHTEFRTNVVLCVRSEARFRDRYPHLATADWISARVGDMRTLALPGVPIDYVIHAASTGTNAAVATDPHDVQDLIVRGTQRVLRVAIDAGASRALLVSSGSVYGRQAGAMTALSEDSVYGGESFQANRFLAESKRAAEAAGAHAMSRSSLGVLVARGFAMSGPWLPLSESFALGNFVRDALAGGPITLSGDGSPVRSYLYGGDVATWLFTILVHGEVGRAVNVGSDESLSIAELAALVADRGRVLVSPYQKSDGTKRADYFVPDISRARLLGLAPRIPIATAVERMLEWYAAVPRLAI